jgi:C4-dicarboxylate-specific signal transduction histidine kinase
MRMTPTDASPTDTAVLTPFRIMVVDDTPENLALIKKLLNDQGFDVYALPNGPMALRAAGRIMPDLILLDITMPEMDGYEVCKRLKADARLCNVPVMFLTALSDTDDKVKGFNAGAVDFITKPFQHQEVLARVTTHLKIRNLQSRLEYQNVNLQELVDAKARQLADAHLQSRRHLAEIAHMNRNITAAVYSAAIAHELNQPLAAILSNAEAAELFLSMDPPAIKEVQEILADIRRDDQRAADMIRRMRNLLKKSEPELQEIDLNHIVAEVLILLSSEARMRNITLASELANPVFPVSADRVQLQQVLINLVVNSMDAVADTPDAKRIVLVSTRQASAARMEVMVADTGAGFGTHLDQVFKSFFTTKSQGLGLGLSIATAIIQDHGGEISAENAPDGGAVVRFWLPIAAAQN